MKKVIARRTKAAHKRRKQERLDKAWRNLFIQPSIMK
ncbi:DUF3983 domain-containing protein [Bacillus cereus]